MTESDTFFADPKSDGFRLMRMHWIQLSLWKAHIHHSLQFAVSHAEVNNWTFNYVDTEQTPNWSVTFYLFGVLFFLTQLNRGSCDCLTNPHLNPTDLKYKILIRRKRILAGSVTSLLAETDRLTTITSQNLQIIIY